MSIVLILILDLIFYLIQTQRFIHVQRDRLFFQNVTVELYFGIF